MALLYVNRGIVRLLCVAIMLLSPIAADRMAAMRALFDEHEEISASMVAGTLG